MRLPGTILQGILARAALTFLRICLGGVLVLQGWLGSQQYEAGGLALLAWAELLVGSTLILGLLTRLSAAGALLMPLQPLFSQELQLGANTAIGAGLGLRGAGLDHRSRRSNLRSRRTFSQAMGPFAILVSRSIPFRARPE